MSTSFGWLGSSDTSGDWIDSNGYYFGPATKSCPWLGQDDTLGDWMDSNGVYFSQLTNVPSPGIIVSGGVVPPLFGTWYGLTWLKNIALLTRDYWDESLTTPYSGQLYPLSSPPASVQNGQLYPW